MSKSDYLWITSTLSHCAICGKPSLVVKKNAIKFYHKVQDDDDQITHCCIPLQALNVDIPWDICSSLISQTQLTFPSFID